MIGAFFMPGPREQPISGFWEKTILVGGITLVGLGSVTRTLALNHRQDHVESGGDEKAYDRYVLNSALSYSLWALGGLGIVLPFVADIGPREREAQERPAERPRPEQLRVLPAPGGVILQIAY